jgi:gamma-glutamylaminecyclotransferase
MSRVFVYGSLMRGEPNHVLLARAAFVGPGRTRAEFGMVSLGAFPAILAGGATAIEGEVFEVDTTTLAGLDRLEGHPRFYRRTEIVLESGGPVETYLLPKSKNFNYLVIPSGSWRAHQLLRRP